jgi:ribonuclease Z
MRSSKQTLFATTFFAAGIFVGMYILSGRDAVPTITQAAGGKVESPTKAAPDRYVYYPGTEELREDEIRVVCCGSGMPAARHGQAACSWLIECGNGEKLLFDLGTGSMANVAALMIPYQYLDKVFLSHLLRGAADFCAQRLSCKLVALLEVAAFSKHADCSTLETR